MLFHYGWDEVTYVISYPTIKDIYIASPAFWLPEKRAENKARNHKCTRHIYGMCHEQCQFAISVYVQVQYIYLASFPGLLTIQFLLLAVGRPGNEASIYLVHAKFTLHE